MTNFQWLNLKFLHQLKFGTNFDFELFEKSTLQKTNLALPVKIQT